MAAYRGADSFRAPNDQGKATFNGGGLGWLQSDLFLGWLIAASNILILEPPKKMHFESSYDRFYRIDSTEILKDQF